MHLFDTNLGIGMILEKEESDLVVLFLHPFHSVLLIQNYIIRQSIYTMQRLNVH